METKIWTEYENTFLRRNYESMTDEAMGIALGRSTNGVANRRTRMRLRRVNWLWTVEQKQYLTDNFKRHTDQELGEALGRSTAAIKEKRGELGLRRVAETDPLLKWSEGRAIYTAAEVVSDMVGLDAYTVSRKLEERAMEARTCLLRLYANGPKSGGWGHMEERAAIKLREIIRELNAATGFQLKEAAEPIAA